MWLIFGDTDDIAFGGVNTSSSDRRNHQEDDFSDLSTPPSSRGIEPRAPRRPPAPAARPVSQRRPYEGAPTPVPVTPKDPLAALLQSMKSSFLPISDFDGIRGVLLSGADALNQSVLFRSADSTLLYGMGNGITTVAGVTYETFPDARLIYNERERLHGWILLDDSISPHVFQAMMPALGFPHIYATRDIIAKIRSEITSTDFLEKCRFFELFGDDGNVRTIGSFRISPSSHGISLESGRSSFELARGGETGPSLLTLGSVSQYASQDIATGEILEFWSELKKHSLRFTLDTFFLDKSSVGVLAGYTLRDRNELAQHGVLTFVIEEDIRARAIVGHIFIDSRGFVHSHEMMSVHKEILKGIRHTYEQSVLANLRIERGELVQMLRREITKYCYLLTGRTPVVLPIIIER